MRISRRLAMVAMALTVVFALAACGKEDGGTGGGSESGPLGNSSSQPSSALELLQTVWDSYGEDEKFAVAGGDLSSGSSVENGPGSFSIDDGSALDTTLGFPAAYVGEIDDAASLMHMMNANTFTCGAYHVSGDMDASEVAEAVKDNILQRQWMCGFPDKLMIVKVGDYLVSFFGENGIVSTFQGKLKGAYPSAETLCDEPIA